MGKRDVLMTPKRFSQSSFDRYRHILAAALDAWPEAVPVDTAPLLASSFKQPCRDAITAYVLGHAKCPEFAGRQVQDIVVAEDSTGQVWVGRNAASRAKATKVLFGIGAPTQSPTTEYKVAVEALDALCDILNCGFLSPTPAFVVQNPSPNYVAEMETKYPNVAILPCDGCSGKYQIL